MAARFYGTAAAHVVAVTGTNGKTSVADVHPADSGPALGQPAASLGTLGLQTSDAPGDGSADHARPDHAAPAGGRARRAPASTHLAIEASSHGLDQRRVDGVRLAAAAFTNISRDHFDYHGSPAAYYAAKRRLFAELLPRGRRRRS